MAIIDSATLPAPVDHREGREHRFVGLKAFFGAFFARAFDPYRPELHYMRGPGPACRAKQAAALHGHS